MVRATLHSVLCWSLLAAPIGISAQTSPPAVLLPTADAPLTLWAGQQRIRVVLVADGLVSPWDIAFVPGTNDLLVTESNGALRLIADGRLVAEPLWTAPSPEGNDVLHGVVVHPQFETNRFVYMSYLKGDDSSQTLAVSRGRLNGAKLVDVEEIFVADAWLNTRLAFVGRMEFGPDNSLYVTVGDRDHLCCGPEDDDSVRILAQSLSSHIGKTLRLADDGSVPQDNPFVDRPDARPEIFTYGHRNGFGLRFHPQTGELWQMEIGPLGGDEINILTPGGNYGWPLVSLGRNYTGTLVSEQPWYREGMLQPRKFWVPAISPAGMAFYTGDKFPEWENSLIIGALSGQHVQRLSFDHPTGHAERTDVFLNELGVRFREVEVGPDGYVYLGTEVRYGTGRPDGAVLRLEPAP